MSDKKRLTKQGRKALADAERRRRWSEWLSGEGKVIRDAGFPVEAIQDEDGWRDFVLHGTLHYHPRLTNEPDFNLLPLDTTKRVLQFLEQNLAPDLWTASGLVFALRQSFAIQLRRHRRAPSPRDRSL